MVNSYTGEEIRIYTNEEIDIRDAYVLTWNGKYYLYGTQGFEAFRGTPGGYLVYVGTDLKNWEGPYTAFPNDGRAWATKHYWAPEVYEVGGKFYLFSAWQTDGMKGQHLCCLVADDPLGPFAVVNDDMGPGNDPTLYQDPKTGIYYLIHNNGFREMQVHQLNDDFSGFVGEATRLFDWADENVTWAKGGPTEGAETYVTPTGKLLILWSSFCEGNSRKFAQMGFENMDYGTAIAYNQDGDIHGPFEQENVMITPKNMGHVNLFEALDGTLMLAAHWPDDNENELGCSNPLFFRVDYDEVNDTLRVDTEAFSREHPEP